MIRPFQRIRPPGIRIQLMLWYTMVFAFLILCSDIVLYTQLRTTLITSLNTALQLRSQQIASGIANNGGTITIQDVTGDLSNSDTTTSDMPDASLDIEFGTFVRILNANGQPLRISPAFRTLVLPPISVTQPLHGSDWQGTVMTRGGQEVRLYSVPFTENGTTFAIIQVGESLTQVNTALHSLVLELLIIAPFILLLSAVGSYWLGTHAFAPMNRLIHTAQRIRAGDLQQRVPVPRAYDEVRALALTLNEMIEHLDQTFTRQRRFVADASHELRTPVTAIRSMTELAQLKTLTIEEYEHTLDTINKEAERLGHLISDLLALARADERRVMLEQEAIRLDTLVEAVVANAEGLALERGVSLQLHVSQSVTVLGDEARLMQAVINLLDNALLYTDAGGRVSVKIEATSTYALLTISDTGIGIVPAHLPHIFERFYRADPARTRKEGNSSGLGLAIVEWTIHAHKGTIAVESQPGLGSTFIVRLPRVCAPSQSAFQ